MAIPRTILGNFDIITDDRGKKGRGIYSKWTKVFVAPLDFPIVITPVPRHAKAKL